MCELFAMSSGRAQCLGYSLHEFAAHGGLDQANKDGWGIALYNRREAFVLKEAAPASESPLARLVEQMRFPTRYAIAHIRWASTGEPALENTHPFCRVVGGQSVYFAHNGNLDVFVAQDKGDICAQMLGTTDSEHVFLRLLGRITNKGRLIPLEQRVEAIAAFATELRCFGVANFLYSDGDVLVGHAHRRHTGSDGKVAPGLWLWQADEAEMPFHWRVAGANIETIESPTTLLASVPLDNRNWTALPEGSVVALKEGAVLHQIASGGSGRT